MKCGLPLTGASILHAWVYKWYIYCVCLLLFLLYLWKLDVLCGGLLDRIIFGKCRCILSKGLKLDGFIYHLLWQSYISRERNVHFDSPLCFFFLQICDGGPINVFQRSKVNYLKGRKSFQRILRILRISNESFDMIVFYKYNVDVRMLISLRFLKILAF